MPDKGADLQLEREMLSGIISRWLDSLDKEDRLLFVRRYWYAETVKDLAAESSMTANQMAKQMQKLRDSLRQELKKEGMEL